MDLENKKNPIRAYACVDNARYPHPADFILTPHTPLFATC
jgi:hypothetical protein